VGLSSTAINYFLVQDGFQAIVFLSRDAPAPFDSRETVSITGGKNGISSIQFVKVIVFVFGHIFV